MRKLHLLIYTAVIAAGCSRGPAPEPRARISRQQFVAVMIELQHAQPAGRSAILSKHKVTEADLSDFVKKYAKAPEYLSLAFDSIQTGVDRIPAPNRPKP